MTGPNQGYAHKDDSMEKAGSPEEAQTPTATGVSACLAEL